MKWGRWCKKKRQIRKETNTTENQENKNILIEKRKEIEAQIKKTIEKNEEEKLLKWPKLSVIRNIIIRNYGK